MLTIRDHDTGFLFDPWDHLGPKRRQLLERSWAGVFREYLLQHLPVSQLASSFCDGFGRPSKDLHMVVGALILQQLHDLTDAQTVEAIAFNITWHYALDIRRESDAYLCERTLRNYRRLLIERRLDQVLFRTLTDKLIASVGVDTSKQRLDSTAVQSAMRSLTRLGIVVETISKFLRELRRTHSELYEQVHPDLWQRYVDRTGEGCFALTTPSESKRRLPEAAQDLFHFVNLFRMTQAATLESFILLERVLDEQCEVVQHGPDDGDPTVMVKAPRDIPCDNVLNPADPDASYNRHKGKGYLVQVMETYCDEEVEDQAGQAEDAVDDVVAAKPDLITHVAVGKMTVHDQAALLPALEDTQQRGVGPDELVADTHYGSNECIRQAQAREVELTAPSMPPKGKKQNKLTLEDFELDDEGRVERCPQGHAPVRTSIGKSRLQVSFEPSVCEGCPLCEACPAYGKERMQYTHNRVRQRARRLAEAQPPFLERYRWRAGVEATMSRFKHQMNMVRLRVRGMAAVTYAAFLRALGMNIFRVAAWRQSMC